MFWYLGNIDLEKHGFCTLFQIISDLPKKYNEKYVVLKFENTSDFNIDELLDEHRRIRLNSNLHEEITNMVLENKIATYDSINTALQSALMACAKTAVDNGEEVEEVADTIFKSIAKYIHVADHRF